MENNRTIYQRGYEEGEQEMMERVVGYITDEEKLLKISKNGAEEVIMNLRTRISSLDKLTE